MAFVSNFDHDIFISYALVDDELLPGIDAGWVSTFVKTLESRLSAAIGRLGRLQPWWDRAELHENQPLDKQIEQALERTACLVVVLSPGFMESPWCPKELEVFRRAVEKHGRADSRIFVVDLGKVTEQQRRQLFPNYKPFDFWKVDQLSKKRRMLGFPAPNAKDHPDFYDAVEDLAYKLKEEFDQICAAGLSPGIAVIIPSGKVEIGSAETGSSTETSTGETPRYGEDDFVLHIGNRESVDAPFPVHLLQSPVGSAHYDMPLPFAAWELDSQLQNIRIAQLLARGTNRLLFPKEVEKVQQFGAQMFEKLIAGDIRDRYRQARRLANTKRRPLPIKLCIEASELAALPWEFLYDMEQRDFLTLSNLTPLVRYLEIADPPAAHPVDGPLRILGVLSSPRDANLSALDVDEERQRIGRAVESLRQRGEVELRWLTLNTVDELQRALNDGPWHIFHFVGHGGYDDRTREGVISMQNCRGEPLLLNASKLCQLLHDHVSLRLVVLNACDTACGDGASQFSSMAGELVRRGIPAVLAMQFPVSDEAAALFAAHFYESLAKGQSVTQAVTEGRKAMHFDRDYSIEWGTPVLMTSSLDGQLFELKKPPPTKPLLPLSPLPLPLPTPTPTPTPPLPELAPDPLKSPLWSDVRYWRRAELPVCLLVACQDPNLKRQLKSFSDEFKRSLPVFHELAGQDHFKTNQSLHFEWCDTSPAQLLAEAEGFLKQDQVRLLVIVSDSLCNVGVQGLRQPAEIVKSLRSSFFSQPHQCGLLSLVPDEAHRMADVDRTLSVQALNRSELVRNICKIADGLRLKTPPGPKQVMAAGEAITVRLAQSEAEINDCLKLRFEVYDRMGYLEERLENANCELDCYDANALHFAACSRAGDILGTVRLILARRLGPNDIPNSIVGISPAATVRRQSEWVHQVANQRGAYVRSKLLRPSNFASLPILQATEFMGKFDNFGVMMSEVGKSMELSRLVVAPRFRGAGLSKLLVRAVIAVAINLQARQLLLECVPAHVRMYEQLGFCRIPGTHGRAQDLDQEAVGMRLELNVPMSRVMGMANKDCRMITNGFGSPDPQMLLGEKHLCMCAQEDCGKEGLFKFALTPKCPLRAQHQRD